LSSQKITSDSGICLSIGKQKSKILFNGSRSGSDSEHSLDGEKGHASRYSRRTSRIPVAVSLLKSGSDSSEEEKEELGRTEPTPTDSGAGTIMSLVFQM